MSQLFDESLFQASSQWMRGNSSNPIKLNITHTVKSVHKVLASNSNSWGIPEISSSRNPVVDIRW